jgi:small subunit ribosomal protein S16
LTKTQDAKAKAFKAEQDVNAKRLATAAKLKQIAILPLPVEEEG